MKAEHVNPFLSSLQTAAQTMLGCTLRRGELMLKEHARPIYDYSGVIGLSGKAVGIVVISLSRAMAVKATCALLMTDESGITQADITDAVGELANMVAGGAKAKLAEYELSISLPSVITGAGHEVVFPSQITTVCAPYESDWGPLTLEFGLATPGAS